MSKITQEVLHKEYIRLNNRMLVLDLQANYELDNNGETSKLELIQRTQYGILKKINHIAASLESLG